VHATVRATPVAEPDCIASNRAALAGIARRAVASGWSVWQAVC